VLQDLCYPTLCSQAASQYTPDLILSVANVVGREKKLKMDLRSYVFSILFRFCTALDSYAVLASAISPTLRLRPQAREVNVTVEMVFDGAQVF
jgi:hypothetical protein